MLLILAAAAIGGSIAAIAGFGIGSILTPALSTQVPATVAVAAVSIPHFAATALRLWMLRSHIDLQLLKSFGVMSAIGGLCGAALSSLATSRSLEITLAMLLLFVGLGTLTGTTKRMRFSGPSAWIAGTVSGFLGGLVGNQGGLRAGAMTGLGVSRDAFVATATATGLIVDTARMPVYFAVRWSELAALWPLILGMTVTALIGTFIGTKLLRRIPEKQFMPIVAILLISLAIWLFAKPA